MFVSVALTGIVYCFTDNNISIADSSLIDEPRTYGNYFSDLKSSTNTGSSAPTFSDKVTQHSSTEISSSSQEQLSIDRNRVLLDSDSCELLFSDDVCLTQGICSFENGIFVSQCPPTQSDYYISKINLIGDADLTNSLNTFNHANGMTYNPYSQKIYICKLSSASGTTGCDRTCDYSFYVVDPTSFSLEQEIDLFDIVKDVCPESIGISGIAFNSSNNKLYVLTRKPKRYIIALNEDFSFYNAFYICDDSDDVLFGDIASFENYLVTCYWNMVESDLSNVVSFYDLTGKLVKEIDLFGITHIESIDRFGDKLIANFNDFYSGALTKVLSIDTL